MVDTTILIWLIPLIIWELAWKGIALWKCGRNNQLKWFIAIFYIEYSWNSANHLLKILPEKALNLHNLIKPMALTVRLLQPLTFAMACSIT